MSIIPENQSIPAKAKPSTNIRVGGIRIPIWRNENPEGIPYFRAGAPEPSYKGPDGQWHTATAYSARDLINLAKAVLLAHSKILELTRAALPHTNQPTEEPIQD